MKKLLIIFITGLSVACSDFLEPKSESEYIPKEASSLNEMLLGEAYVSASNGVDILKTISWLDDDIMCSNVDAEEDGLDADEYELCQAFFTWQPDACVTAERLDKNEATWEIYYGVILGANAALDYIDDVAGTEDEKNNVKAQALALRGYYYFQLVNFFGAPYNYDKKADGVPLKLTSALGSQELPRNSVEEVYTQVLEDLKEAERLYKSLPEDMQFKRNGRTSLPMVQLLLSRVYLYMENWPEAAKYAQQVIDNKNFSLADLNTFISTQAEAYYNFATQECPETIWVFGSVRGYWSDLDIMMKQEVVDKWGDTYSYSFYFLNASSDLVSRYLDNDLRKTKSLVSEVYLDKQTYKGVATGAYLPFGKFAISKNSYGVPQVMTTSGQGYFAHTFRLSEAYLNLAEASVLREDEDGTVTALEALNDLREKRYENCTPLSGLTGDALLEKVREERRLELCFEGHRWFDLRRYGMPAITHDWKVSDGEGGKIVTRYTLQEKDPFYTLPIPEYIMEMNRALTQNPLPAKREGVQLSVE